MTYTLLTSCSVATGSLGWGWVLQIRQQCKGGFFARSFNQQRAGTQKVDQHPDVIHLPLNNLSCQKYILGDLEEMPIDKMVDLSGRQVRRFPLCVCSFRELVKLYLSDNKLNNLPPELEQLHNLQILALDFNNFHTLPSVVCTLKQLSILYLGNNKLGDLPVQLRQLQNLKTLWIESNRLYRFPSVVCELRHLKTLHAGSNALRSLPGQLQHLKELRTIWLSSNQLVSFPPVLLHMPFLEVIDVDCNTIRDFPNLTHLSNLKLVIYDHNPCRNAPKVAKGVHRVGRWSEESPEPRKRSGLERSKGSEDINSLLPPPPRSLKQSN